ncbi:MAG: signal recognition particle-docking protein FtsY [Candidatus Micrarchaeota archaeon]
MFGFLKKAIGNFVDKVSGKKETEEQAKPEETPKPVEAREQPGLKTESVEEEIVREAETEIEKEEKPKPEVVEKPWKEEEIIEEKEQREIPEPAELPKPVEKTGRKPFFEVKEEKKELAPKVGLFKKITGMFTGSVTIGHGEVEPLFDDLRIALLESDVSLDTTEFLINDLNSRLEGKQVPKGSVNDAVRSEVRTALMDLFGSNEDFLELALRKQKPVKILFLGPNGAGKTTTIAKLAFLLKQKGFSSVIAASDTFRAAAIEQASLHGERLGVRVIKHKYGADPSAVAFDAIEHAKAEKLDFVLIDTAGRQETNYNLVKEMEKINRVIRPDFKLFVGESVAGHALVEQARKFNESVGLDGLILTKLDVDAKGGTAFSIAHDLKTPIFYIGVGQEYSDLKPFDSQWLVNNVLS